MELDEKEIDKIIKKSCEEIEIPKEIFQEVYKNLEEKKSNVPIIKYLSGVAAIIIVILIVIIVGMFLVNYLTGNSVNVFNYENALIDKYESWENNLKEREAAIREKENELGIEYTDDVDDETVEAE